MAKRAQAVRTPMPSKRTGERVADIQRSRLLAAATAAACEEGAASVTVTSIVERARVSRRTFYELFGGVQECLLATFEEALTRAQERVVAAWTAQDGGWQTRVRAGLAALLELFDRQPQLARLLVVEWPAAGSVALQRRMRLCAQLADAIDQGRREGKSAGCAPPALTGEGLVGAVAGILHARLLDPAPRTPMLDLLNPLMSAIVLPYLGNAAARRELARPAPVLSDDGEERSEQGAPENLGIRITYRTVRVLRATAAHPGASNRLIAQQAGVADQGQISKLLRRLERAGIVENVVGEGVRGAPNAWTLTVKGEQVERSLRQ